MFVNDWVLILVPHRCVNSCRRPPTVSVPPVRAVGPRQRTCEGREEVEERPGDDHVVVDGHNGGDDQLCHAQTYNSQSDIDKEQYNSTYGL